MRLQTEGDWSADIDSMILYSPLQPFPSSSWDWIGLYKVTCLSAAAKDAFAGADSRGLYGFQVGFSSVSDYITYTWVKDNEVAFNQEVMQVPVWRWSLGHSRLLELNEFLLAGLHQ